MTKFSNQLKIIIQFLDAKFLVKYRYIMSKTGHDIKLGKYKYGSDDYIRNFIEYENEFKATRSMRDFLSSKLDYPKEIYGKQIMRLNPKPVHYEL